jgi:hypothetical protein
MLALRLRVGQEDKRVRLQPLALLVFLASGAASFVQQG